MNENYILLLLIFHMCITGLHNSKWMAFGVIQWINDKKLNHQDVLVIRYGRMKCQEWFLTCDCITGGIFHWDTDDRRHKKVGGKCWLSFRHVGFRFQLEVKVSISSRQLGVQVWSSEEELGVENGFENHPSNAVLEIMGKDKILSFCLWPSSLPKRILYARVDQRTNRR